MIDEHVKRAMAESERAMPERQATELAAARGPLAELVEKRQEAVAAWERYRNHRGGFDPGPVLAVKIATLCDRSAKPG